ncbi:MAG: T9SS type A sorting domain-containing protein, partial [Bacteroidota bacterium]
GVTMDQQTQTYFIQIIENNVQKIKAIDVNTGVVLADQPVNIQFIELQANNQTFALQFYGGATSIEETIVADIQIYPNPSHDQVNIEMPADFRAESVRIFNAQGALMNGNSLKNINSDILELDVSNYDTGLYFIEMINNETRVSKSFSVVR